MAQGLQTLMYDFEHEQIYANPKRVKFEYQSESICRWGVAAGCCVCCCWSNLVCCIALCCIGAQNRDPMLGLRRNLGVVGLLAVMVSCILNILLMINFWWAAGFPPVCYHNNRELCASSACVTMTRPDPVRFTEREHHWLTREENTMRKVLAQFYEYGTREHCVYGLGPAGNWDSCHDTILSSGEANLGCAYYTAKGTNAFTDNIVRSEKFAYILPDSSDDYANGDDAKAICKCLGGSDEESWLADYTTWFWFAGTFLMFYIAPHVYVFYKVGVFTKTGTELLGDPIYAHLLKPGADNSPFRGRPIYVNQGRGRVGPAEGNFDIDVSRLPPRRGLDEDEDVDDSMATQGTVFTTGSQTTSVGSKSSAPTSAGSVVVGQAVVL